MVAEDTLITETSRTDQTTSFHENFAQIFREMYDFDAIH